MSEENKNPINVENVLQMVKTRLDRYSSDAKRDEYLRMRIASAIEEQQNIGITLYDTAADMIYLTDLVCWEYSSRDKAGGMPEWLRLARRERWLQAQLDAGKTPEETDDP